MKLIPLVLGALTLAGGAFLRRSEPPQVLILSGDTQGYLAPCGCSEPMVGGIKRRGAAIRALTVPGRTTILENNGMVSGAGRQDEMKAETVAQTMEHLHVTAINFGASEARLGEGMLLQLARFAPGKLTTLSVENPESKDLQPAILSGPFMIAGASAIPAAVAGPLGQKPVELDDAVRQLVDEAKIAGQAPILMLDGGRDAAVDLARKFPALVLIQYRSVGNPPEKLQFQGGVAMATTGERGKHLVRMEFSAGRLAGYQVITLSPAVKDDPEVARLYETYLSRVSEEKLLEKLPRRETDSFAGSWACVSCHQSATKVWKNSHHRFALETLQKVGHDRDPDCVGCHVVGLGSTNGFRSASVTPALKGVGCESCHGPALSHARKPAHFKMARVGEKQCITCHNPQNSPNFDFDAYWRKIRH